MKTKAKEELKRKLEREYSWLDEENKEKKRKKKALSYIWQATVEAKEELGYSKMRFVLMFPALFITFFLFALMAIEYERRNEGGK